MIEYTPEARKKICDVADDVLGTCQSLVDVIEKHFGQDVTDMDLDIELLRELDDLAMECEVCGWWCETGFLNDQQVCDDCEPMEDGE